MKIITKICKNVNNAHIIIRECSICPRACVPSESYRGLGFANYHLNVFAPWNTILMRPLLPLISSLCLAGDFRCSFARRMRLFGETAHDVVISRICQIRNIANAANLPNVKFRNSEY
ncbi:hypothetical protein PUN28_018138 [Cardiocondyla obscurior]|uniref:Uncharacterized protein n=1 Tax=Cardiocondyla obscurior TaxID=286306 RepID=A0AAW2EJV5_9HYME